MKPPIGALGGLDLSARLPEQPSHLGANGQVVGAKLVLEPIGIVTPAVEQIHRDSFERVEIVEVEVGHGCYLLNPVSAPTG